MIEKMPQQSDSPEQTDEVSAVIGVGEGYDSGTLGPDELGDPMETLRKMQAAQEEIPSNVMDRESYVIAYDTRFQRIHEEYLNDLREEREEHASLGTLEGFVQEIPDIQIEAEYRAYAEFARKYPEDFKKYLPEIRETTKNDPDKYRLDEIIASVDTHVREVAKEPVTVETPKLTEPIPTEAPIFNIPKETSESTVKTKPLVEKPVIKSSGVFAKIKTWLGW